MAKKVWRSKTGRTYKTKKARAEAGKRWGCAQSKKKKKK